MLAERFAVIGGQHDEGVIGELLRIEPCQEVENERVGIGHFGSI